MNTILHVYFNNKKYFENPRIAFDHITAFIIEQGCFSFKAENGYNGEIAEDKIILFPEGVVIEKKVLQTIKAHLICYDDVKEDLSKHYFRPLSFTERNSANVGILNEKYALFNLYPDNYEKHICNDILYDIVRSEDNKFKDFVDKCIGRNLSIKQMAAECGYSYTGFLKKFKHELKKAPCDYIQNKKLIKANQLLACGKSVTETATDCGFENEYYFSNWFKKQCSLSPAGFKKKITGSVKI